MKPLFVLIPMLALAACADDGALDPDGDALSDDVASLDGTDDTGDAFADEAGDDEATLKFMREEEKLARDVYDFLDETWGTPTAFANIEESEQSHMDALLVELDRLDLEDPVVDDTRGVFADPLLTDLYDELTTTGAESVDDALAVGALIEDLDIVDLQEAAVETDDVQLVEAYATLECGSRNHLRAFVGLLEERGIVYAPQFLPDDAFEAIVSSPRETCG